MTFEELVFHVDYDKMLELYKALKHFVDKGYTENQAKAIVVNNHINGRELTYGVAMLRKKG